MTLTKEMIFWAAVMFVMFLAFFLSWRFFFSTEDDTYRSRVRKCANCSKFQSTQSFFDGYCRVWKRKVIKKSICKHYYPNNFWVSFLEKMGF
jgi:hypothetical protein